MKKSSLAELSASWHTLSAETLWSHLKSTPEGLINQEASERLAEFGPNELGAARRV